MKKRLLLTLMFFLITALSSCNRSSSLKKAKIAEATGNMQDAYTCYVDALLKDAPSMKIPDVNRSKFLERKLWKKEVEKYIVWISVDQGKPSGNIQDILGGISRCLSSSHSDNSLANLKVEELTSGQYLQVWNKTFFAPTAAVDPEHEKLASGNFTGNLSFISISSPKNYTYELSFVNLSSGKKTDLYLYPESEISFMAPPGDYLLICRSTVTFSSGELWRSQYTTIPVKVPLSASLITGELRTSVNRK